MAKPQPCYLLQGSDPPENASFCESIAEAKAQYERSAAELYRYGQEHSASLHFVEQQGDDFAEYPDRILRYSGRNVIVENT